MTLELLIANVGGILGLFLGISFITGIDGIRYMLGKIADLYVQN